MATSATGQCLQTLSMEVHVVLKHEPSLEVLLSEESPTLNRFIIMYLGNGLWCSDSYYTTDEWSRCRHNNSTKYLYKYLKLLGFFLNTKIQKVKRWLLKHLWKDLSELSRILPKKHHAIAEERKKQFYTVLHVSSHIFGFTFWFQQIKWPWLDFCHCV